MKGSRGNSIKMNDGLITNNIVIVYVTFVQHVSV